MHYYTLNVKPHNLCATSLPPASLDIPGHTVWVVARPRTPLNGVFHGRLPAPYISCARHETVLPSPPFVLSSFLTSLTVQCSGSLSLIAERELLPVREPAKPHRRYTLITCVCFLFLSPSLRFPFFTMTHLRPYTPKTRIEARKRSSPPRFANTPRAPDISENRLNTMSACLLYILI